MIILEFPIAPVAKGRPRFTKAGFCYTPKETKDFEKTIKTMMALQMKKNKWEKLEGPLMVNCYFNIEKPKSVKRTHPTVKPDIDNFQKALFDAANGIVWEDDAQICCATAWKRYGEPRVVLEAISMIVEVD